MPAGVVVVVVVPILAGSEESWWRFAQDLLEDYLGDFTLRGGSTMPAPRSIARFNKRFTNRLTSKVAGYLPGFAIVSHIGRKSGRLYRTPVNAFRTEDGYIIALTYGSESDWVKNVLAAGSCELKRRGRRVCLTNPRIETDKSNSWAPLPVRLILGLMDAPQYMRLSLAHPRPEKVENRG